MCGAPIILSMIINAEKNEIIEIKNKVNIMTAAAAPPPAILAEIEKKGFEVTHVYGLTEVYGPAVVCEWKEEWNNLKTEPKSKKSKTRSAIPFSGRTLNKRPKNNEIYSKRWKNNWRSYDARKYGNERLS